jgi:TonB-linked SusC/RagA family outer membrane protein
MSEGTRDYFYGARENFPLLQKDQFWATGASRSDSYLDGTEYESGRVSYIGRLTYQYSDKYYLNASLRRDGSMLFAPGYRWGNFPSVSLGWVLSNEDFMKDKFFNYLKLRGTWGMTGNDVVGGWKWQDSYSTGSSFMIGTTMAPTVLYNGIVNEKLTWEKTREFNIGLDSRFLNGVILNFEYYQRHNYDILDSRIASLPASFGGTMPPVNYGIVDGHGLELEVGYAGHTGKFNYEVKGNLTYATNKVVEKDVPQNVRDVNNPIGRSTDYVACLVSKGIIRTQADLDAIPANYTAYGLKPRMGDVWYEDISGPDAGVPDGKIDDYDRQVIKGKHYLPPYMYGLNLTGTWKGFSLDLFFQGTMGISKMYDADYAYHRKFPYEVRPNTDWLDSWSPENTNASFPRPDVWGNSSNDYESTFWLKKGDYLRLKYLNLSYSIPKGIIKKLNISKATLMLSGTNLFTISGFKYYDPSIASKSSYPTMKAYTFGINVSF